MYSRVRRRFIDKTNRWLAESRRGKLVRTDFSIFSNNCWAGSVYRYFGLPYLSPTVGLYFWGEEFPVFAEDLRYYCSLSLQFIPWDASTHCEELVNRSLEGVLVARLGDVEIVFLHYSTEEEARTKWERRLARVNWSNVFLKFSEMNGCRPSDIERFDAIPFSNSVCFASRSYPALETVLRYPGYSRAGQVLNDTDWFDRCLDVVGWLNSDPQEYGFRG